MPTITTPSSTLASLENSDVCNATIEQANIIVEQADTITEQANTTTAATSVTAIATITTTTTTITTTTITTMTTDTTTPITLPLTPTHSDDEGEDKLETKSIKLARRGTISLADLIPLASEAFREKRRLSCAVTNASQQDSQLARALTKIKIGVTTQRIKERSLTSEWIRLALARPIDESAINGSRRILKNSRTMEIVKWYEYKHKRSTLSLQELEAQVDRLRQQRVLLVTQHILPSSPATRSTFKKCF